MTSDSNAPAVVQLFEHKRADSHRRMATTFAAFVRTGRSKKKTSGYVVFSSHGPMKAFRHANFVAFWVSPEREGSSFVASVIDSTRQYNRELYLDENFREAMIVDAVAGAARRVINDKNIARALAFGLITVDANANATATLGTGECLSGESIARRAPKIVMVGCTDLAIQRAVKASITKHLLKGSGSMVAIKKLTREIRKITGQKVTGVMAVEDEE